MLGPKTEQGHFQSAFALRRRDQTEREKLRGGVNVVLPFPRKPKPKPSLNVPVEAAG